MRKSFIVHNDSLGILDSLSDEQCGELFRAIKAYQLGEDLELSPIVDVAFYPFKSQFIRDNEKYQNIVDRNKLNGSKGGRPKNPVEPSGLSGNPEKPQKADSVSKSDSKSDSKSKNDSDSDSKKTKTLDQSKIDQALDCTDFCFDNFWKSGIRKVNKKKTKSLFSNLLKRQGDRDSQRKFTGMLINDVRKRLNSNQLGFAEMHPTTYLNGERWNDEVITNDQSNRPNGAGGTNKLSAVERVRATNEANRAARADTGGHMANTDGHLREFSGEPVRAGDAGGMDSVIEGSYTTAD